MKSKSTSSRRVPRLHIEVTVTPNGQGSDQCDGAEAWTDGRPIPGRESPLHDTGVRTSKHADLVRTELDRIAEGCGRPWDSVRFEVVAVQDGDNPRQVNCEATVGFGPEARELVHDLASEEKFLLKAVTDQFIDAVTEDMADYIKWYCVERSEAVRTLSTDTVN